MTDTPKKARLRTLGHELALKLMRVRPGRCTALVGSAGLSTGRKGRPRPCKNPVAGDVDGRPYCATHLPDALAAHEQYLTDEEAAWSDDG